MEKNINQLIPDILKLLESGAFKIDGKVLGEMIERRLEEKRTPQLSMSNFGKPCERQLWFQVNRPELAQPLDGPTRLKFLIGDIIEEVVLSLAEQAGHKVVGRQDDCSYLGIPGHRDAVIDGLTVDVKSANSRSFEKFRTHNLGGTDKDGGPADSFGYLDQLSLYVNAGAKDPEVKVKGEGAFLAVDKELGRMVLDRYPKRAITREEVDAKLEVIYGPTPPKCVYSKGPRGGVPWQCSYCSHKDYCHNDDIPEAKDTRH